MPDGQILSFGPYQLDLAKEQLWCNSQPIRLTPKAFQVLCALLDRPGQLVTKEELFRGVWVDTVVGDAALTMCIQELRKALQDNPRSPQYLETVHRRGFRFIGKVVSDQLSVVSSEEVVSREEGSLDEALSADEPPWIPASAGMTPLGSLDEAQRNPGKKCEMETRIPLRSIRATEPEQPLDAAALPTQRAWSVRSLVFMGLVLLVGTMVAVQYLSLPISSTQPLTPSPQSALPLPDKPSIIVLPLVNLSGDPEQEYFSDGLTEVLTGDLSRISSLFVIARNSAFTYKGKAVKVQDVSREMGVRYVLEGSVQKGNQRIRIAVQLIDATTGYEVWSEQYDRPLTDIFTLQDEIVQKIVTTLKLQLTLQEQGYTVRKHTDNLEAYDYWLRGMEYFGRLTKESNLQARQMWEHAVALDPHYAEAQAWLSDTYYLEGVYHWSADPQTLDRALALGQQAVALDDSLPIAHSFLSYDYSAKQQYDQAIAEGERAIALDPNNADSYSMQADALNLAGRPEEALKLEAQAVRLNPRYPFWYLLDVGFAYQLTGRYAEAISTSKELISRTPNLTTAYSILANSYLLEWYAQQSPAGQTLEPVLVAAQRALALGDSQPWNHVTLGTVYLFQQQYEQALAEMERAVALAPTEAETYAGLALVLSCMGRTENALEAASQTQRLKPVIVDSHLETVGIAYALAGHFEEAIAPLKQFLARYPNRLSAHLALAGVYSKLGQDAKAQKEAAEVLQLNPNFSLEVYKQRAPIKDPAVLERGIAALRKAGLK